MTLCFLYSLYSHCRPNRPVKNNWPANPTPSQSASLFISDIHLFRVNIETRAPDQPPHAEQIQNADQGTIEVAVLGYAGTARSMIDRIVDGPAVVPLDQ